ncbi:MAG: LysR substrate-binding domain-containing protein, partial [Alphaproteobacteria bacterium]
HPDISLNINPELKNVDLVRDNFDVAIRFGNGEWPNLNAEPLTDGSFIVVSHPELVSEIDVSCLKDLEKLPWLMEPHMMEKRAIIENEGLNLDKVKVTSFDNNGLVLSGVLAGLGVSVQPSSLVQREIEAGNLCQLCVLDQAKLGYYIVTVPNRETPALKTFKRWLHSVSDV